MDIKKKRKKKTKKRRKKKKKRIQTRNQKKSLVQWSIIQIKKIQQNEINYL